MAKSNSIYGLDETGMAERISGEALRPSGKEDFWGSTFDQSAKSKGNASDPGEAKAKGTKGESDGRAKTAGNHGKQD